MKTLRTVLCLVALAGCTQLQGKTALEAIADNTLCVSEHFDQSWETVLVECGLRGENLDYLRKLWASSRRTAVRAGAVGMAAQ
jgi:hypothetical protein